MKTRSVEEVKKIAALMKERNINLAEALKILDLQSKVCYNRFNDGHTNQKNKTLSPAE